MILLFGYLSRTVCVNKGHCKEQRSSQMHFKPEPRHKNNAGYYNLKQIIIWEVTAKTALFICLLDLAEFAIITKYCIFSLSDIFLLIFIFANPVNIRIQHVIHFCL